MYALENSEHVLATLDFNVHAVGTPAAALGKQVLPSVLPTNQHKSGNVQDDNQEGGIY
jgi:hypothetical protein